MNALAGEYVLGTMRGRARQRFESFAASDPVLSDVVSQWQRFLDPLTERVAPIAPPSRVWTRIEARLGHTGPAASVWSSLAFWRWVGAGFAAAAVTLFAVTIGLRQLPAEREPMMVAVLATPEQDPRIVVEQPKDGMLRLRMVKPWVGMTQNDLELWVIPKEGKPRSLGVVPWDRDGEVRMANLEARLQEGVAFAISKEPLGGSPSGQPTGPVLCSGMIARSRRA
jgi:anti-sigma-K factor RskA